MVDNAIGDDLISEIAEHIGRWGGAIKIAREGRFADLEAELLNLVREAAAMLALALYVTVGDRRTAIEKQRLRALALLEETHEI
jgi:hypothetical protein